MKKVSKAVTWDNCPHSKRGETKLLKDKDKNAYYEVCFICNLSRKVEWDWKTYLK